MSGQNQLKGKIMVKGKKPIRLKPIKRTVHSSQGGTIKILLPKDFIAAKTRPSSKDDEITKIRLIHTVTRDPTNAHSSYVPSTKNVVTARDIPKRNQMMLNPIQNSHEQLCNVTVGQISKPNVYIIKLAE